MKNTFMTDKTYVLLSKVVACAGFCYLVTIDRPWLGLLCIFFSAYISEGKR